MKNLTILAIVLLLFTACAPARTIVVTSTPGAAQTPSSSAGIPNTGNGLPNFDHIIMIVLEDRDYSTAMDGNTMPHLVSLAQKNVLLSNYFAASHPSLPNYLVLVSGSNQSINTNCTGCFFNLPNLADEIEKSGRTWKAYMESMPSPCYSGDAAPYAQIHNPLYYFNSIQSNATRCGNGIVPLTQLDNDLSANKLPNFLFIEPNLCNSGQNCTGTTADGWVNDMVTKLQTSPALGSNSLIAITFDEASNTDVSSCCGLGRGGGHVATILISPSAKAGYTDDTPYSHYSLLKTILRAWDLPDLGRTNNPTILPITNPWTVGLGLGSSSGNGISTQTTGPQAIGCGTSSPDSSAYTVKICFSNPSQGGILVGDVQVNPTVDISTTSAEVKQMTYYLDGKYLLTAFYSPYSFTLPTAAFLDGNHTLSVEATMKDSFTTSQIDLPVKFNNGVTSVPQNTNTFKPTSGVPAAAGQPFIVAATGDAAGGDPNESKVVDLLNMVNPNLLLYLGDVYEKGSPTEFSNWYGTSNNLFAQFRAITDPTVGNHEYLTDNAAGYFNYWDNISSYYSVNANGWHIVSLNSNGSKVPTAAGSDQYNWLQQDLQKNIQPCTIVFYHEPLYNIGSEGPTPGMADIWKLMAQYKVSIVLNGHDHDYQRWVPLDGTGQPNPNGITEFVVGTGGHGLQNFPQSDPRVAYKNNSNPAAFGALFLQLNPAGANFYYENTDRAVLDSGVIPCVGAKTDVQPPTVPAGMAATVISSSRVDLTWNASIDNQGVAGYSIYRNGSSIATIPAYQLDYSDTTVAPSVSYTYTVVAFDESGRRSFSSIPVKVLIPGAASSMVFTPVADAYVNGAVPASYYGKQPYMRIDTTPVERGYMRFTVSGLSSKHIAKALLLLYANNTNKQGGLNVTSVANNAWGEYVTNYNDAPALGGVLASSGPFVAGSWITLDVSKYVTAEGTYSFGLTTAGTKPISVSSREAGLNSPQLIIYFQ